MNVDYKTPQNLVDEHQGLVISIAKRIYRRLPPYIRYDDVVSYGQLGLLQAARSFNDSIGSSFATFAYYRIRGAMYDGLTKMAWTSRSEYRKAKAGQMAGELIEADQTDSTTGAPTDDFRWLIDSTDRLAMVYLNSYSGRDEFGDLEVVDQKVGTPDEDLSHRETIDAVRKLMNALPEPEQTLIRLTYFENLSLAEAAEQLGKSRSWGSRVHSRVLSQMARSLQAMGLEAV